MYSLVKHFLFLFQPETAHKLAMRYLRIILYFPGAAWMYKKMFLCSHPALKRQVAGIEFPNPVGLAAGFDKDAEYIDLLPFLGFGFVEVGTVTPLPQPGNEKPRLFRLVKDKAIINRMGFNNKGLEAMKRNLMNKPPNLIVGSNIGKNKVTPNEHAASDYLKCFSALHKHSHYFTVNVSSPNTPGLRELQEKEPLKKLLRELQEENAKTENPIPIFLKIAPDLSTEQLDDIIEIIKESHIAGVIATNTTISREGLQTIPEEIEKIGAGGLSGKPLSKRATDVIRYLSEKSGKAFPIIGVGGIHSVEDALEKLDAGADLIQVYTGFIYEGPSLVKKINQALIKRATCR